MVGAGSEEIRQSAPLVAGLLQRAEELAAACERTGAQLWPHSILRDVHWVNATTSSCPDPPTSACEETEFTVIAMAFNGTSDPTLDRLTARLVEMARWIRVREVVLVWNSALELLQARWAGLALSTTQRLRVKPFIANSLLNRYRPSIGLQTAALMYVDEDGPFPSEKVADAGFQLWRRAPFRQVGAYGRHFILDARQRTALGEHGPDEHRSDAFLPFCRGDRLGYHVNTFPDFDSHMLLPSTAFLHQSYLCHIWSERFTAVREFVGA